jgi:CubicO group peptidase (beta-lactamase class C family)
VGFCVLGQLITRRTGQACGQYLRGEVFEPLEMTDTILGMPDRSFTGPDPDVARVAEILVPEDQRTATEWNWNSRYQRQLGAPWGGLLSTPEDLARFAQMWLSGGETPAGRLLSAASVEAATRNQLADMPDVPLAERRDRPRGLSWWLRWPGDSSVFGDRLGPRAFGHWGTSGTVFWIDPDRDALAVFLTTQSHTLQGPYLPRMCDAIAACLE